MNLDSAPGAAASHTHVSADITDLAAGGDWVRIDTKSGVAASYDFTSIPGTYKDIFFSYQVRESGATGAGYMTATLNNDTGANYEHQRLETSGATVTGTKAEAASNMAIGLIVGSSADAGNAAAGTVEILNSAGTTFHKNVRCSSWTYVTSVFDSYTMESYNTYRSTSAITRATFTPASGSFEAGSVMHLWGRK
jgi:hypothetical protein